RLGASPLFQARANRAQRATELAGRALEPAQHAPDDKKRPTASLATSVLRSSGAVPLSSAVRAKHRDRERARRRCPVAFDVIVGMNSLSASPVAQWPSRQRSSPGTAMPLFGAYRH